MKRLASAESLSEWGGNTVLFNDDVGDITVKVQARLPKFRRKKQTAEETGEKNQASPSEWIRKIGEVFYESWKISKNWLLIVKNSIAKVIDKDLLTMLNSS